ncbi:YcjX family protein [Thalassotalea ponticola]|uniref:YcjX family protein n=1 Tax=Thalassotalea ponticola TaxID=1523392 RepID=UPI0025B3A497|nr:YcjX family protein [Thalassotalea ponticola]MDN3653174.1 YcjX family protein [Thalassotalea ponticola]
MAIFSSKTIKNFTDKLSGNVHELVHRSADKHVSLAVTGLSQSGKTAFITSLVNQLLNESAEFPLHFFDVVASQRFIGAKRVNQKHLHIARFDYQAAMAALAADPPEWPEPTRTISELRLAIRYTAKQGVQQYLSDAATLYLDITDYPGEWLLDLPMLDMSYRQWSESMRDLLYQQPRYSAAEAFLKRVEELSPFAPADEALLASLAAEYTELLHQFRNQHGLSIIQPGRFILPGEHQGAPILQFIPYPFFATLDDSAYQKADPSTMIGMLQARYIEYQQRLVKGFYKKHFSRFDRQIVLMDPLSSLNFGRHAFDDLQRAITVILESFNYGKSNVLSRLFSPKIDKLLFAATKADHIPSEQHPRLLALLEQLVHQAKKSRNFDGINMQSLAIASVNTTQQGTTDYKGQPLAVIKGRSADSDEVITLYPGAVPTKVPSADNWPESGYRFTAFKPMHSQDDHIPLPHIRLDQALQFLLGDKLR